MTLKESMVNKESVTHEKSIEHKEFIAHEDKITHKESIRLKEFILKTILVTVIALFPLSFINYIVDPYQFYRRPTLYKPVYFNDQRYQNPGLARTQDYSLAIVGTSMTDNFLTSSVQSKLDRKAVKLSMMGASMYEQKLTTDVVTNRKKADTIIWELNYFAFRGDTKRVTETGKGFPYYLYDNKTITDLKYLCNFDTLLRCYYIFLNEYKGKMHYTMTHNLEMLNTWYSTSKFCAENAMKDWNFAQDDLARANPEEFTWEYLKDNADKNLIDVIKNNPAVEFVLFYPPFSILAHKFLDERGLFENEIALKKYIFENCKDFENLKIFDFQDIETITHNLDNYRDMTHYSIETNEYMLDSIAFDKHIVSKENIEEKIMNLEKQARNFVIK
jgi:hypothetical protein